MAQLINKNSSEFRRCNLSAIQTGGTWASLVPDENEIILISTANALTADGSGNFDAYVVGDGTTAATALELRKIDDIFNYVKSHNLCTHVEPGSINVSNGSDVVNNSRARTGYVEVEPNEVYQVYNSAMVNGYTQYIFEYTTEKTFIKRTDWSMSAYNFFTTGSTTRYIRMSSSGNVALSDYHVMVEKGKVRTFAFDLMETFGIAIPYLDDEVKKIQARLQALDGEVVTYSYEFEIGDISTSGSNINYGASTKRVRLKKFLMIELPPGSSVWLTDYANARFAVIQLRDNGNYVDSGWKQEEYIIAEHAFCTFLISNLPEVDITDVAYLAELIKVKDSSGKVLDPKYVTDIKEQVDALQLIIDGSVVDTEWEKGNISMSATGWTYSASGSRVRLKQGTTIHLKVGATIGLTDYSEARFYVGWRITESTYGLKGWNNSDFITEVEGDYTILLSKNPESTVASVEELSSLVSVKTGEGLLENALTLNTLKMTGNSLTYWRLMHNLSRVSSTDKYTSLATRLSIVNLLHMEEDVTITADTGFKFAIHFRQQDGTFISDSGWKTFYKITAGTYCTLTFAKSTDTLAIQPLEGMAFSFNTADVGNTFIRDIYRNEYMRKSGLAIVKGINHRGANELAPENTMPAFELSHKFGWSYVETDVEFTSDNVPVLLHDSTIDRTSNGTGNVHDYTYQQLLEYDFGSWKNASWAGTKIPTLREFLIYCKRVGMKPYIEIKQGGNFTDAMIQSCVDVAIETGMLRNITWISFSAPYLQLIIAKDSRARVGYVASAIPTSETLQSLMTGENEVFLDFEYYKITDSVLSLCKSLGIGIEVWTVDNFALISTLNEAYAGITSDRVNFGVELINCADYGMPSFI